MRKILVGLVILMALIAALMATRLISRNRTAGPASVVASNSAPNATPIETLKTTLRLKWIVYIGWAGEYAALDQGFWKNGEGLDVEIRPGGFEQDPIRLVPAGADEFGIVGGDTLLMAREKGVPVVAIGLQYQVSPAGLMAKTSSGIRTPKDLEGRRVGISPGTDKHAVYLATLGAAHVDRSKIQEIPVKFDLTPFFTDQVDVFPVFLPNQPIQAREKGVEVLTIDPREYGISYIGNVYFTTEKMIRDNPDKVRRFLRGAIKGWDWALQQPPVDVANMMLKYNSELSVSTQTNTWQASKPYILPENRKFGWMTRDQWEVTARLMKEQGLLTSEPDLGAAFTTKFLEEIYPGQ